MVTRIKNLNQTINMSKEDIIINNTLIRDFMEVDAFEYDEWKVAQFTEGYYHLSYDWLMPVIEKIEKTQSPNSWNYSVIIEGNSCKIYTSAWGIEQDTICEIYNPDSKFISIWKACIEFIKYYNENKSK